MHAKPSVTSFNKIESGFISDQVMFVPKMLLLFILRSLSFNCKKSLNQRNIWRDSILISKKLPILINEMRYFLNV